MHYIRFLSIAATAAALAAPAFAQSPAHKTASTRIASLDAGAAEVVPDVAPGEEIMIACAPIEQRSADSDVRVVLTIAAMPSEVPPGYKRVLATDEQLGRYGVRVLVPDVPDLPNHTVNLNVYVVDSNSSRACDGGHVKVVNRRVPDYRHEAKPDHVSSLISAPQT
jgi:hypothetical protein